MESLGTSPGALSSTGLVFQLVSCFHRYWAYGSKSTVRPKMESCFQDGACSVCFLLHSYLQHHCCMTANIFQGLSIVPGIYIYYTQKFLKNNMYYAYVYSAEKYAYDSNHKVKFKCTKVYTYD